METKEKIIEMLKNRKQHMQEDIVILYKKLETGSGLGVVESKESFENRVNKQIADRKSRIDELKTILFILS